MPWPIPRCPVCKEHMTVVEQTDKTVTFLCDHGHERVKIAKLNM